MAYLALKNLHLATIALTLTLFVLRGVWMMADSPQLQVRWVRIVPHVNDTLLLSSGIGLAIMLQQYPLVHGWLTAKFFALIAYIVLGTIALKDSDPLRAKARVESYALKRGKTKARRIIAWIAALLVFGYMVTVARAHAPFPFSG
jgi:uncharacterized membrane protein SirB2